MKFGLIGEHLGHSWSPLVHRMASGMDYCLAEVPREDLGRWLRETPFRGINVTIPYKQAVIEYLDSLSAEALETGAVNTITKADDGSIKGYNTDVYGAVALMSRTGVQIKGRKVVILGRGGAAKAFAKAAMEMGAASVRYAVRSPQSADSLPLDSPESFGDCEILVNATPVGMYPEIDYSPLDISRLPHLQAVFDCIYNPLRSALVLDARSRGIPAFGGLRMLVAQALQSEELFFSAPDQIEGGECTAADESRLDALQAALAGQLCNIVLCGMPCSGKTTAGRALAVCTGREFIDTDAFVCASAGCSIAEIFASEGEEGFRRRESEVIRSIASRTGAVISVGGGAVLSKENLKLLRHNGILVLLERPLELIAPSPDRPLAMDRESLGRLAAERSGAYHDAADVTVRNDGDLERTVEETSIAVSRFIQTELP